MRIALVAPIRHPIAEPFNGGLEAHCRQLCDGLRARGHDVTLFAAAGSHDPQLHEICAVPLERTLPLAIWRGSSQLAAYHRAAFATAWDVIRVGSFDVVHNVSLFPDIVAWAARDGVVCVTSHHVAPVGSAREIVERHMGDPGIVVTVPSRELLRDWSEALRMRIAVVHGGVCCEAWQPAAELEDFFIWSGRITPSKGTALAARAARIAGAKLRIVGAVEDAHYFGTEVEPFLRDGVEYHGHRSSRDLAGLVARARAALVTPMWEEPFSVVAAEALACGTPVIAFDRGALAEVVGECGLVVPPGDVMALAGVMAQAHRFDRAACRARAQKSFALPRMIAGYEACYDAAIASRLASTWPPRQAA